MSGTADAMLAWRWSLADGRPVPARSGCSRDRVAVMSDAARALAAEPGAWCVRVEQVAVGFMTHKPTGTAFTGQRRPGGGICWTTAHDPEPVEGSAYRTGHGNCTGTPAILRNAWHYPVSAVCRFPGCSQVITRASIRAPWQHAARLAGEAPGPAAPRGTPAGCVA